MEVFSQQFTKEQPVLLGHQHYPTLVYIYVHHICGIKEHRTHTELSGQRLTTKFDVLWIYCKDF